MAFLKALFSLWPFVKELFIGDKEINKNKVIVMVILFLSLVANIIAARTIFRMYNIIEHDKYIAAQVSTTATTTGEVVAVTGDANYNIKKELLALERKEVVSCPKYILPNIPDAPDIPLKEISAVKSNDTLKLSNIEKNYILELRAYIEDATKKINDSYSSYIRAYSTNKKC